MSGMNSVNDRLEAADQDGAYDGKVVGYVTTNDDPDGTARIKVRIPNVFDTDQGDVPWCLPTKFSPFGQGPGYGVYGSPKLGSPVRLSFQNGDPHYPIYEADEYLKANANPKFKSPDTWGFKDPGGSELFVNMQTGAWEFTHQSGNVMKYDGQGNMTLIIKGNRAETIEKDDTLSVQGKKDVSVTGDYINTVNGGLNFTVQGNVNITAQGTVTIQGSQVNIN